MVNKNTIKIRKKLDKLDNSFLSLVKKRTLLVDQILKNKRFKKDIIDRKRISLILRRIKSKSKNLQHQFYVSDYTENFQKKTELFFSSKIILEEVNIF